MDQHTLQQLRQHIKECRHEGIDPCSGDSEAAQLTRDLQEIFGKEPRTPSRPSTYGPFSGPAESAEVVKKWGLDDPRIQAMSYSERRKAGKPVCRRNSTGRCMECQHQGPCPYSRALAHYPCPDLKPEPMPP
jgi:hypothetical protein